MIPIDRPVVALAALCLLVSAAAAGASAPTVVPKPPEIGARAHLLVDHHSGRVLSESNADLRVEPASLTKILTAYVVFAELEQGKIRLDDMVRISEKAWRMPGSRTFVEVDAQVPVDALVKGVIVQSGNDASVALAEHIAGDETVFASLMNEYAARIGMTDSHFVNSSGLPDPQHYTTARDMARLSSAIIRDFPDRYRWHAIKEFEYGGIRQVNRNNLLWRDASVDGLKTGYTEAAGYCLVASAERNGMRLISVVMGADSGKARARYSESLLNFGFRFYETHRLFPAQGPVTRVRVWKGETRELGLGVREDLYVTVPRGEYDKIDARLEIEPRIEAPVAQGSSHGVVRVSIDGEPVGERTLVALHAVPPGSLWQQVSDYVRLLFE